MEENNNTNQSYASQTRSVISRPKAYMLINGERKFVWSILINNSGVLLAKCGNTPNSGGIVTVNTLDLIEK